MSLGDIFVVMALTVALSLVGYQIGVSHGRDDKAKTVSPAACECCGGVAHYTEDADGVKAWCRGGQFSG